MANQSVPIPANTVVDLTAEGTLVAGTVYAIQPRGAAVWLDEQLTAPSDRTNSLYLMPSQIKYIQQSTDNFYISAKEDCKIVVALGSTCS